MNDLSSMVYRLIGEIILKRFFILFFIFILISCSPAPSVWGIAVTPTSHPKITLIPPSETAIPTEIFLTPTSLPTVKPTSTLTNTPLPTATSTIIPTPSKADIERVIVISYDGLRPDAIDLAPMPNLIELRENGAQAPLTARTIDYPATLPSHASMLSGWCMEDTGIIYNKFYQFMGYSKGVDIFDLAHQANMQTIMIVSKDKMRQLAEPETTDVFEIAYGEPAIQRAVLAQLEEDFDLMFIHFAGPDNRGHKWGWMSYEYFQVLREGDAVLGEIIKTLKEKNMFDSTMFIITSDHGGHDRNHIGLIAEDYRITWIAYGPGVKPIEITRQLYTFDTAATVAYALGLPLQPDWAGIPVYEIFW
ncbi:MAG: type I phosphodiesterase/nucleotide pyrophosphatase [Chloroflexi bacterium OLB14]|nr:MAG: type I phosphodiesterase/nucleotide pyrophosphatase [Chloroflexi bacterium OLB14]